MVPLAAAKIKVYMSGCFVCQLLICVHLQFLGICHPNGLMMTPILYSNCDLDWLPLWRVSPTRQDKFTRKGDFAH